jgi:acetyl esterase/lipase
MSVVELTTFSVERTSDMLAARPAMLAALHAHRRGFLSARLVRLDERRWCDIVAWTDDAALDESRAKGADQPGIAAFFDTVDTIVGVERALRYDDAATAGSSVRTVAYGPHPAQVGELYLPAGAGPHPVAVLIHGGFYAARYDRRQCAPQADDLVGLGYAVWNVEYRRVGDGGGWPATFTDVAAAMDALDGMDPALDLTNVTTIGNSAGGQLAIWAAARDRLPIEAPGHGPRVRPTAAVSLAGVLDLVAADKEQVGSGTVPGGAARAVLGGPFPDVPQRYEWMSPVLRPAAVPTLVVHGTADDLVPPAYSRDYRRAAGAHAELVEIDGAGHRDLRDPAAADGWRAVRNWLTHGLSDVVDRAWRMPGHTAVDVPAVDVNQIIADRYELDEPLVFTGDMLWDMEVRKASAPDVFIPSVVAPGSVEKWGADNDFVRISAQRRWLDPAGRDLVIERVHIDHDRRIVNFVGMATVTGPDGGIRRAGTGQPLFHVEHAVGGTDTRPLNLWRIVHLTETPDEPLRASQLRPDGWLREYIEIYIRNVLGRRLTRKQ